MVYNKLQYLPECLESVINQDSQPDQIIIWDAGSDDGSRDYLKQHKPKNARVIFADINLGISLDKNRALALCATNYVVFLDADDLWDPSFISTFRSLPESALRADIIGFAYTITRPTSAKCVLYPFTDISNPSHASYVKARISGWGLHTSSTIIRRQALIRIGGYPFAIYCPSCDTTYAYTCIGQQLFRTKGNAGYSSRLSYIPKGVLEELNYFWPLFPFIANDPCFALLPGGHGEDQYVHDYIVDAGNLFLSNSLLSIWRNTDTIQMSSSYRQSFHFDFVGALSVHSARKSYWAAIYAGYVFSGIHRRYSRNMYDRHLLPALSGCLLFYDHDMLSSLLFNIASSKPFGFYFGRMLCYFASILAKLSLYAQHILFFLGSQCCRRCV